MFNQLSVEDHDHQGLQHALQLARHAESLGEVPVGAVLMLDGAVIGEGWNCPISSNDPTAHAEVVALRNAAQLQQNYRLLNSTLYVNIRAVCNV